MPNRLLRYSARADICNLKLQMSLPRSTRQCSSWISGGPWFLPTQWCTPLSLRATQTSGRPLFLVAMSVMSRSGTTKTVYGKEWRSRPQKVESKSSIQCCLLFLSKGKAVMPPPQKEVLHHGPSTSSRGGSWWGGRGCWGMWIMFLPLWGDNLRECSRVPLCIDGLGVGALKLCSEWHPATSTFHVWIAPYLSQLSAESLQPKPCNSRVLKFANPSFSEVSAS